MYQTTSGKLKPLRMQLQQLVLTSSPASMNIERNLCCHHHNPPLMQFTYMQYLVVDRVMVLSAPAVRMRYTHSDKAAVCATSPPASHAQQIIGSSELCSLMHCSTTASYSCCQRPYLLVEQMLDQTLCAAMLLDTCSTHRFGLRSSARLSPAAIRSSSSTSTSSPKTPAAPEPRTRGTADSRRSLVHASSPLSGPAD